jgi:hypothetical protein
LKSTTPTAIFSTSPGKRLGLIDDDAVGHDQPKTEDIQLLESKMRQESNPRLVQQTQQGVVAHMPAIIDIGDPHPQLGG